MTTAQLAETVQGWVTETGASVPPYDVRRDAERGRRRCLKLHARRVLRRGSLYLLDGLCLTGAWYAAGTFSAVEAARGSITFLPLVVGLLWLSLTVAGTYRSGRARHDYASLGMGLALGAAVLWAQTLVVPGFAVDIAWVALFSALAYPLLVFERWAVNRAVLALRQRGFFNRRALVLGDASSTWDLIRRSQSDPDSDLLVVGHLVSDPGSDPTALGGFGDLETMIEEHDIEVVGITSCGREDAPEPLVERSLEAGVPAVTLTSLGKRFSCKISMADCFGPAALELHPPVLQLPQLTFKRVFDLSIAVVSCAVLVPVFLLIALLVKLDSAGPVFFRQTRVGVGGRPFDIFKFRSMYVDAEERKADLLHLNQYGDGRLFKIRGDPRVTRIGAFLRRTSLDELPQLFNVLLGDMSVVGPRPPIPEEVVSYERHHLERLTVLPGITGPWQVNGRNDITDFEDVVEMEREYIRDWTLGLDLRILFRTVRVVLSRQGAL